MRPGRCIAIRGGSRESRLACAAGIARCCSESGDTTVSFAGTWNSTGDPDPYNGYPFSSLVLVAREASLVYRRPGVDPAAFSSFSDISADLVLVGLPGHDMPGIALDAAAASESGCLATWGFDAVPLPRLDGLQAPVMLRILGVVPEPCRQGEDSPPDGTVSLSIGDSRIPLSGYPARVLSALIESFVGTLHGAEAGGDIRIDLRRGRQRG